MCLSNLDGRGEYAPVAATKLVGLDQIREGITAGLTILGEKPPSMRRFPKSKGCGGDRSSSILSGACSGERFNLSWELRPDPFGR